MSQASLESLLGSNSGQSGVMDPGEVILRMKERTRRTQRKIATCKEADLSVEEIESPGQLLLTVQQHFWVHYIGS